MSERDTAADVPRWQSTNLVGLPAGFVASVEFNDHPQPLRIAGTQETHSGLFRLLDAAQDAADAECRFRRYMDLVFGLRPSAYELRHAGQRRYRPSYLKLLEGWGFDANSPQGAVLKGWVESRFGLVPTFHRAPLRRFPSPAWVAYIEEKSASRFHSNSIYSQLDLLYEYCQWHVRRFGWPARNHATLWRGVNLHDEPEMSREQLRKGDGIVRLNNLVSFSDSRERAGEFGDWILEVHVPVVKLLYFPGLLSTRILAGEGEVIALGGQYRVRASYV